MLTSLAPAITALSSTEENSLTGTIQKPSAVVQHKGVVGFLQAFLTLQQGLATFHNSKQAAQVRYFQMYCFCVVKCTFLNMLYLSGVLVGTCTKEC